LCVNLRNKRIAGLPPETGTLNLTESNPGTF
jgi:hypothetical protein